ncbi:hypothetical protein MMPV_001895 [Pyropia vietnamensis]
MRNKHSISFLLNDNGHGGDSGAGAGAGDADDDDEGRRLLGQPPDGATTTTRAVPLLSLAGGVHADMPLLGGAPPWAASPGGGGGGPPPAPASPRPSSLDCLARGRWWQDPAAAGDRGATSDSAIMPAAAAVHERGGWDPAARLSTTAWRAPPSEEGRALCVKSEWPPSGGEGGDIAAAAAADGWTVGDAGWSTPPGGGGGRRAFTASSFSLGAGYHPDIPVGAATSGRGDEGGGGSSNAHGAAGFLPPTGLAGLWPGAQPPAPAGVPISAATGRHDGFGVAPPREVLPVATMDGGAPSYPPGGVSVANTAGAITTAGAAASSSAGAPSGTTTAAPTHACPHCSVSFGRLGDLRKHISCVHAYPRRHACDTCGRRFGERSNMIKHVAALHLKRRDAACPHCEKRFAFSDGLSRHVRLVHQGERAYGCGVCGARFKQNTHLQKHARVHLRNGRGGTPPK